MREREKEFNGFVRRAVCLTCATCDGLFQGDRQNKEAWESCWRAGVIIICECEEATGGMLLLKCAKTVHAHSLVTRIKF